LTANCKVAASNKVAANGELGEVFQGIDSAPWHMSAEVSSMLPSPHIWYMTIHAEDPITNLGALFLSAKNLHLLVGLSIIFPEVAVSHR
jgi:hypothetical protein